MNGIDRNAFAAFLVQRRKEKNMTQKELAARLYVSDKAVSKWERALSLPDVALLVPLAEALEVSVTELLEGRRLEEKLDAGQVEALVQKAIRLTEQDPEAEKKRLRRRIWVFAGIILVVALEKLVLHLTGRLEAFAGFQVMEVLSAVFGIYFWFFMKERLPDYYDQNRIGGILDGPFRMNVPGVCFNNGNWPHIVRYLRIWSGVSLAAIPVICFGLSFLETGIGGTLAAQMAVLAVYLGSLFVPVYLLGRRYDSGKEEKKPDRRRWVTAAAVGILLAVLIFQGPGSARSATRVGFVESGGWDSWSARYVSLNGSMSKRIYPAEGTQYLLTVESKSGALDITVTGEDGEIYFSRTEVPSGVYPLTLPGDVWVTVEAESHKGSFSLTPAE